VKGGAAGDGRRRGDRERREEERLLDSLERSNARG